VLSEYLPVFLNCKDQRAYTLAVLKLIGELQDTHGNLWQGAGQLDTIKGIWMSPFKARFIEDRLVVTDFYSDDFAKKELIEKGDVILTIDGEKVETLLSRYLPYTPASNRNTQLRDLAGSAGFLLRSNKPTMVIEIENGSGQRRTITCEKILARTARSTRKDGSYKGSTIGFKLLEDSIGYIFPASLGENDLPDIQSKFAYTKGIVIDLRCYPSVFMPFTYGEWLKPNSPFVRFSNTAVDHPGKFFFTESLENGTKDGGQYKGQIVILVDEHTQSQAEYTTMAFQSAKNAVVIGSQTAGADGNVSSIAFPGGMKTLISGIGIYYPDGTVTQRVGVKIDKVVKPTIKGIRQGKDECLEKAIEMINSSAGRK